VTNFYKNLYEHKGFYLLYESLTAVSRSIDFVEGNATEINLKLTLNMWV